MLTIYGIPNCDTCRKARKWLEMKEVKHLFHDIRADGLEDDTLRRWSKRAGWQSLLNTRSKTWRSIAPAERNGIDEESALELMLRHPTLVKRPVLEKGKLVLVGFSAESYSAALC
jgi:Spx/MgsR family transcriptional regulator